MVASVILAGLGVFPNKWLLFIVAGTGFVLPTNESHLLWQGCLSDNLYGLMAILSVSHVIKDSLLVKKGIYGVLYRLSSKPKWLDKFLFNRRYFDTTLNSTKRTYCCNDPCARQFV